MIFIVSPHFDDAVGSTCGFILNNKHNYQISIVTIFTGPPQEPISGFAHHLHDLWELDDAVQIRTKENEAACRYLGIEAINLGFTEAIYRKINGFFLYPEEGDIFREISNYDIMLSQKIADRLNELTSAGDVVILPAGVGMHVDHLLTTRCRKYLRKDVLVFYYRDFSYEGEPDRRDLTPVQYYFDEAVFRQKITSLMCYRSQINMLFDEFGGIEQYYADHYSINNRHFEVFYLDTNIPSRR